MLALFYMSLLIVYCELYLIIHSAVMPKQRIWPPENKHSWQFYLVWSSYYIGAILIVVLAWLTWNSWTISHEIRWFVGLPLVLLGGAFDVWAVQSLGLENSHGVERGFVARGAYRFTRNPQYVGSIVLFFGLIMVVNSLYVAIVLLLLSMVYVLAPLAEELWLEERYGENYLEYKHGTPRFL